MDLSFAFTKASAPAGCPGWAVLVAGVTARQAASPTAAAQARLAQPLPAFRRFAPVHGRFDASTAAALARWKAG